MVRAGRPADDALAVQVQDGGHEEPSGVGPKGRHVGDPGLVRGARGEVSFEQVGRDGVVMSRVGRGPKTPPLARHQARFTHALGDLPLDDDIPAPAELPPDARAAVASLVLDEDSTRFRREGGVPHLAVG